MLIVYRRWLVSREMGIGLGIVLYASYHCDLDNLVKAAGWERVWKHEEGRVYYLD